MRQFTSVALSATYLCLALIVALLLWRNGGGWAAGVAALVGGLGLCFAVHGLIGQSLKLRALRKELDAVREALAENRVDLYLQPVVGLPQRRTVFYESYSRLRDASGRVMMPAEYLAVAEPEGLVTSIDNLLLFRCVQIVRRLAKQDRKVGIFCNISIASLADESFFPQFLDLLAANRDLSGALIFEIGQAAFDARGSVEARNMGKLADLGFRFSLDKVVDILELDVGMGQGHLFGEPRAIKEQVLAETDPPAEFLHPSPRRRVGARG